MQRQLTESGELGGADLAAEVQVRTLENGMTSGS
jgi:hypothetical protein